MDPDGHKEIRIGRPRDRRRGAPCRQARDIDACGIGPAQRHGMAGERGDHRRLAAPTGLIVRLVPVPAPGEVRALALLGIEDDKPQLIGQPVHAGADGEIHGRLRTAMQHHDQRHAAQRRSMGRVEPIGERALRAGELSGHKAAGRGPWQRKGPRFGLAADLRLRDVFALGRAGRRQATLRRDHGGERAALARQPGGFHQGLEHVGHGAPAACASPRFANVRGSALILHHLHDNGCRMPDDNPWGQLKGGHPCPSPALSLAALDVAAIDLPAQQAAAGCAQNGAQRPVPAPGDLIAQ